MKKTVLAAVFLISVVALLGVAFGCAKPAPAPTTAPTTAPSPAPSPSPTTKPTTAPSATPTTPVITLKLGHQYPVGHTHDEDSKWVAAAIKERTKGAVDLQVYPAQTLFKQAVAFEEIQSGRADLALIFPYFGQMPTAWAICLPFLWQPGNYEAVSAALKGGLSDMIDKSVEKLDLTMLGEWGTGSLHFYSAKKPLKTLEDLKGVTLRTPSGLQSEAVKLLGVAPVDITATAEIYTAIQRGTVNGGVLTWETGASYKLNEVCRYATTVYFNLGSYAVLMKRSNFNKIPDNYQKVIREAFVERQDWRFKNLRELEDVARKQLEAKGVEVYDLPVKEWNQWAQLARGSWDGFFKAYPETQKLVDVALKYSAPSK